MLLKWCNLNSGVVRSNWLEDLQLVVELQRVQCRNTVLLVADKTFKPIYATVFLSGKSPAAIINAVVNMLLKWCILNPANVRSTWLEDLQLVVELQRVQCRNTVLLVADKTFKPIYATVFLSGKSPAAIINAVVIMLFASSIDCLADLVASLLQQAGVYNQ